MSDTRRFVKEEDPFPTHNRPYNSLLEKWKADGYSDTPECEECEKDMTALPVVEGDLGWYCSQECKNEAEGSCHPPTHEDFHADG